MKAELENRLGELFPEIFTLTNTPKGQPFFPICFGCEHGDGWYDLIFRICEKIHEWNLQHPESQIYATQIKEKYGTLRFYTNHGTDEIYDLISDVESESATTCEVCGSKDGKLCTRACWYMTRCPDCIEDGYVYCDEEEEETEEIPEETK